MYVQYSIYNIYRIYIYNNMGTSYGTGGYLKSGVLWDPRVSGTHSTMEKWVEGKLNKAFFIFC